jgi:fructosamine-3-kinase
VADLHPEVQNWLNKEGLGGIASTAPVGGGCIHQALRLRTERGDTFFLKQNRGKFRDIFYREAEGLGALDIAGAPVVPRVYLVSEEIIILEDLAPAPKQNGFWTLYGQQLAKLHLHHSPQFGFKTDNYIGANPQLNSWYKNGYDFYRENRLGPQIRWAQTSGALDSKDLHQLDELLLKLQDLVPEQPASLLHGDLWSGNLITDREGSPALIDPAVYWGWAEADLAMTDLFGRYPDTFYKAYTEINPLEEGYRGRFPLYNLYHLLNHLNLFGRGYLSQVRSVLSRYL